VWGVLIMNGNQQATPERTARLGGSARACVVSVALGAPLFLATACTTPCTNGTWTWYGGGTAAVQLADAAKGKATGLTADGLTATDLPWQGSLSERTGAFAKFEGDSAASGSVFLAATVEVPAGTPADGWSGGWLQAWFWSSTGTMGAGAHAPSSDELVQLDASGASLSGYDAASLDLVDPTHATLQIDGATFACPEGSSSVDTGPSCTWDGTGPLWLTVSWSLDPSVTVDEQTTICPQ